MRTVKSVLLTCGKLKQDFPDEDENVLTLRAIWNHNFPKLLSFDIPLFEGILSDVFLVIVLPTSDHTLIRESFEKICAKKNLEPSDSFFTKLVQTYEILIVRHGLMLVGRPYSGKSSILKMLAQILPDLKSLSENRFFQNCFLSEYICLYTE